LASSDNTFVVRTKLPLDFGVNQVNANGDFGHEQFISSVCTSTQSGL